MAVHGKLLNVQVPSPTNYGGQNGSASPNVGKAMDAFSQAESLVSSSKKLENEVVLLGQNIKDHEENIEYLKTRISSLDDQITDIQVTLGKSQSSNSSTHTTLTEDKDLSQHIIQQHQKSAGAIVSKLKSHEDPTCIKDVLGVVATLGKLYDDNLSRIVSEYLGLDTMLALVCMTYDGVKALETYFGLYGIERRLEVICLENMRPYVGEVMGDDPQRRLALVKPKLPNGKSPLGFLGFAVNMIHIDIPHLLPSTSNGYGLRETLFYNLFSRLQVYRSRADMVQALPCISDGAVSLDGGMIRRNGVFVLGMREEMDVRFGISSYVPENLVEIEKQMKELKWERETMVETLQIEEPILGNIRYTFEIKKQEFVRFMAQTSPYATMQQYPIPATPRRTTPG
ncbi:hypothetical protein LXL04_011821 [Taraxacum kok-saghyz]